MKYTSVNIQMAQNNQQILLSFAVPKTNHRAMEQAKAAICEENSGRQITKIRPNPPEHGKNLFTAYNGFTVLGWITLNEVS